MKEKLHENSGNHGKLGGKGLREPESLLKKTTGGQRGRVDWAQGWEEQKLNAKLKRGGRSCVQYRKGEKQQKIWGADIVKNHAAKTKRNSAHSKKEGTNQINMGKD